MEIEIENNLSTQPVSQEKHKKRRLKKQKDLIQMDSDHTKEENNETSQQQSPNKEQQQEDNYNKENDDNWEQQLLQEFYGLKQTEKVKKKQPQKQQKVKTKKEVKPNQQQEQQKSQEQQNRQRKKNKIKQALQKIIDKTTEKQKEKDQEQSEQEQEQEQEQIQKTDSQEQDQSLQQELQSNKSNSPKPQKNKTKKQKANPQPQSSDDWLSRLKSDPLFAQQQSDEEDDVNLAQMPLSSSISVLRKKKAEKNNNIIKTKNKFFNEIKISKDEQQWDINQNQLLDDLVLGELEFKEGQKRLWDGVKAPQQKKSFNQVFNRIKEWKRERALLEEEEQQHQPQEIQQQITNNNSNQIPTTNQMQLLKKTPQEMKEFLNRSCSQLRNQGKDIESEELKLEIILPKIDNDHVIGNTLFINKMSRTTSILKNFDRVLTVPKQGQKSGDIKEQLRQQIKLKKSRNLTMEDVKKRFLITSLDDWDTPNYQKKQNNIQRTSSVQQQQQEQEKEEQKDEEKEEQKEEALDQQQQQQEQNIDDQNNDQSYENDDQQSRKNELDIEQIIELEEEEDEEEQEQEQQEGDDELSEIDDNEAEEDAEDAEVLVSQDEEQYSQNDQEQSQNDQKQSQNHQQEENQQEEQQKVQQLQEEQQQTPSEQQDQQQQKFKKLRTVAQKLIDKLEHQKLLKQQQLKARQQKALHQQRLAANPKTKEALRRMLEMEAELGSDHEDHDSVIKQIDHSDDEEHESQDDQFNQQDRELIDENYQLDDGKEKLWEKFQQDVLEQERVLLDKVMKGAFRGAQKRVDDGSNTLYDGYENNNKRKLQMVQERIHELENKEQLNSNQKEFQPIDDQNDQASLFSDDEEDQEKKHLLQMELELKRKILTEHPISLDHENFVDPEIMKKVVYVHPHQERDTFGKLMTPKKSNNNSNNLLNSNSKKKLINQQQQNPFWSQQNQLQNQIFTSQNFNRNSVLALRMDKRQISRFNSQIQEENIPEKTEANKINNLNEKEKEKEDNLLPDEQPQLKRSQTSYLNQLFVSGTPNKVTQIQHMMKKTPVRSYFTRVPTNHNNNNYQKQNQHTRPTSIFKKQSRN